MLSASLGCTWAQSMENAPLPAIKNYCRRSPAGAVQVQLAVADVDRTARRRIRLWSSLLLGAGRSYEGDEDNGCAQKRSRRRESPLRRLRRLNRESSNKTANRRSVFRIARR